MKVVVIGNFDEADARSYFEKEANVPVKEADWAKCYEVSSE